MSSIGDALLLDGDFIALRMSSFENKVNENEFSLSIILFFDFCYTFIVFEGNSNTRVFAMSAK